MDDEKFKVLLEAAPVAIVIVDEKGIITLLNSQAETCFGYCREELLGQYIEILLSDGLGHAHVRHRQKYMENPHTRPMGTGLNLKAKRKDGSVFPVDISLSPLAIGVGFIVTVIIHDITDHKKIEAGLKHIAEHDYLTGLVNRSLFEDRINQAIVLAKRHECFVAVFFLDVDNFKQLNDAYGHAIGDLLLSAVGKRMQGCIREIDTLARIGGDEFALLLTEIKTNNDAMVIAKKILQRFKKSFLINDIKHVVTLSIGIALYPTDGDNHLLLLEKADAAMYLAKKQGKNNVKFYTELA